MKLFSFKGLTLIGLAIAGIYFAWSSVSARLDQEARMLLPCYEDHIEVRCYTVPLDMCVDAWKRFDSDCKDEARSRITRKNATALVGAGTNRCIYKKYDRLFRSSRRTATDENECQEHFHSLDALGAK